MRALSATEVYANQMKYHKMLHDINLILTALIFRYVYLCLNNN